MIFIRGLRQLPLFKPLARDADSCMTREYVELAMREGFPFEINMAEGKSYHVPDQYSIALLKNTAVIVVEEGLPPAASYDHWDQLLERGVVRRRRRRAVKKLRMDVHDRAKRVPPG